MPRAWVVEDHDLNFELIDFLLVDAGWSVVRARDGAELTALLGEIPPDLVLLDMNLPDVSGLELVATLRADPDLAALPVIAVTAHAMRGDRERFLAAGCNAYVSKPIDATELFSTMEQVLGGSRS
jgi:two-component system cell cycle response regulator DivK